MSTAVLVAVIVGAVVAAGVSVLQITRSRSSRDERE
jgi:hypothetical protein